MFCHYEIGRWEQKVGELCFYKWSRSKPHTVIIVIHNIVIIVVYTWLISYGCMYWLSDDRVNLYFSIPKINYYFVSVNSIFIDWVTDQFWGKYLLQNASSRMSKMFIRNNDTLRKVGKKLILGHFFNLSIFTILFSMNHWNDNSLAQVRTQARRTISPSRPHLYIFQMFLIL